MNAGRLSPSVALAAYAEAWINGAKVVVFGNALSLLAERLIERGARHVQVYDVDSARAAEASAASTLKQVAYAPLELAGSAQRDGVFDVGIVEDLATARDNPKELLDLLGRALSRRGVALIGSRNPDVSERLIPCAVAAERPLGYYDFYDLVSQHFEEVRMLGQTPFVGYAIADFSATDASDVRIDTALLPGGAEEPEWFLALASALPVSPDAFSVIQLPIAELELGTSDARAAEPESHEGLARAESKIEELEAALAALATEGAREAEKYAAERSRDAEKFTEKLAAERARDAEKFAERLAAERARDAEKFTEKLAAERARDAEKLADKHATERSREVDRHAAERARELEKHAAERARDAEKFAEKLAAERARDAEKFEKLAAERARDAEKFEKLAAERARDAEKLTQRLAAERARDAERQAEKQAAERSREGDKQLLERSRDAEKRELERAHAEKLGALRAELEKREEWLTGLESRAATADERADAAQAELDQRSAELRKAKELLTRAEHQLEEERRAKRQLDDSGRAQKLELDKSTRRAEAEVQRSSELGAESKKLGARVAELTAALAASEKKARQAAEEGDEEVRAELAQLEASLKERAAEVTRLTAALHETERFGRQLIVTIGALEAAREPAAAGPELEALRQRNAELSADLEAARWTISSLEANVGEERTDSSVTGSASPVELGAPPAGSPRRDEIPPAEPLPLPRAD